MKKHFLVLMILCFSMGLKSENYHPFPTENTIWHSVASQLHNELFSHKYFINGDTIIENETWQKIYFTNNYLGSVDFKSEMNYVAALRENEQKQILAKFPQLPEFVLYDFSLEIGDTIWYEYAAESSVSGNYPFYFDYYDDFYAPHYKVVVDKDSILLKNGQYRNRLILHSFSGYGNLHIHNHWVEGFGCTRWSGLFHPIVVIRLDNGDGVSFACFMQDDEVIYLNNPYCDDCLCETFASADYHPFPTESAIWHSVASQIAWDMDDEFYYELFSHKYFINGDTIIENETWQKIYFTNNYLGGVDFKGEMNYVAALRENEQKQILAKFSHLPEFVLYDFSLEIGDTIWYEHAAESAVDGNYPFYFDDDDDFYSPHYKVVVDKDSVLLENGEYRNRLTLYSYVDHYGNIDIANHWVEGFGCTRWSGLFHPIVVIRLDNGDGVSFACFMQDDEVIYLNNPYCDDCLCETFTSIDHVDNTDELLNVYPNPSKGNLTIAISESATGNLVLRITDISGKITFEQFLRNQRQINMNLGTYKSGFYIIQLWDVGRNKLMENRKIIIE